jgi:integrase
MLADTPNMANRVLTVLRLIYDYAVEQQMVANNPATGIRPFKLKKRTRLISAEEFDAIYTVAAPRLQIILELWRLTGQRVVDVIRIRRADLKDDGVYFQQEKTDARLIVRWNPELRAAVERAKTLYGNVRALTLFHTRKGSPPSYKTIYDQWSRACAKSGVTDVQPRDLRAMSITEMKRQQGKKSASALAGHKSEAMTDRYIRDREIPVVDGPSFRQPLDIRQKG